MNIIKFIANALGIGSSKKSQANRLTIPSHRQITSSNSINKSNKQPSTSYTPSNYSETLPIDKANNQSKKKPKASPPTNYEMERENRLKEIRKEIDEMPEDEIKTLISSLAEETIDDTNDVDLDNLDPMFGEAARLIVIHQQGSTSLIQRKFKLGYNRAGKLIDQLEAARIVGPFEGSVARDVLISDLTQLESKLKDLNNHIPTYDSKYQFNTIKNSIFYEKYRIEIENKRADNILQNEREIIRQELLEKNRKKQLRRDVLKDLKDEGLIKNPVLGERKREPISQEVMDAVWNRDSGRCVKCSSQENLEFDHIIPFSKGGSNTYKNLQILCKTCNIEKSNKIG